MALLDDDDEMEQVPLSVTNYHFEDSNSEPVSFELLPLQFDDDTNPPTTPPDTAPEVFLHGATDGGLQKVFKQVTAWRLGFQEDQPAISVLSKEGKWISLQKPRKSYGEGAARTVMIMVQALHFLRKNLESSKKSLWAHLQKFFQF